MKSLMDKNFPASKYRTQIPIVLKINYLNINESIHITGGYALAVIKISFYQEKDGKLAKLFVTDAYNEMVSISNVSYSHSENIAIAIRKCISAFTRTDWETNHLTWEDYQTIQTQNSPGDYEVSVLPNRKTVILGDGGVGFGTKYYGITCFSYDENNKLTESQIGPADYFPVQLSMVQKDDYDILLFTGKTCAIKRINDSDFAMLMDLEIGGGIKGLTVPRENPGTSYFVLGAELGQNIVYLPKNNFGLVCSVGIFENFLFDIVTPKISIDVGVKASVGIQF